MFGIGVVDYALPFRTMEGIENYDKATMQEKYGADMDSGFLIFPESVDNAITAKYESKLKTGLFDTDGFFILEARYNETDFENEIRRLADITCEISYAGTSVTNQIEYDEEMYKYPAYIASDGYDYVYEYALIDKANQRSTKMDSASMWGLFFFVAIPLPGTGAWTGTLAASFLNIKFKDTIIAVILGVLIAGLIMMAGSLGLFSAIFAVAGK